MGKYTKEDIIRRVMEEDIQFIRMQFTDIFGQLKNVAITASQIEKAVNNQIMIDGSSIEGFVRIEESDQYLWPDLDTFSVLPWRPQYGKVARLICDVHNPNGTPFVGDPRNVLKRVLRRANDMGFTFNAGPELEFFLFQTDENGKPTTQTSDEAGYFDLGPLDHGESTRREICLSLEQMGFEIEASHHEVAAGQHEIDFKYTQALQAADNIMTFKLAVKTLAQKNGLHATFMPKPVYGTAGSGMHVNLSLCRDGHNLFEGDVAPDSEAGHFIAGILAHARELTAFCNPVPNSYSRFGSCEAPQYISWSRQNRSQLVRLPSASGEFCRLELRSPDPACNPYLVIGLILAAGLDGMERELPLPAPVNRNLFHKEAAAGLESLPRTLREAITVAAQSDFIAKELPLAVMNKYFEYQTQLCIASETARDPAAWEREHCFLIL